MTIKTSILEKVLKAALRAGANGVDGVQFRSTDLRKYKDKARRLALKAAKEKATAMAATLGQKIGQPRAINESPNNNWYGYGQNVMAQNRVSSAGPAGGSTGEVTALGQIRINAKVSVVFELK